MSIKNFKILLRSMRARSVQWWWRVFLVFTAILVLVVLALDVVLFYQNTIIRAQPIEVDGQGALSSVGLVDRAVSALDDRKQQYENIKKEQIRNPFALPE